MYHFSLCMNAFFATANCTHVRSNTELLFSWMVPGQILKIKFQENPDYIKHEHQDKILINPGSDQLAKIGKTDKPAKNLADKENLIKKKL